MGLTIAFVFWGTNIYLKPISQNIEQQYWSIFQWALFHPFFFLTANANGFKPRNKVWKDELSPLEKMCTIKVLKMARAI